MTYTGEMVFALQWLLVVIVTITLLGFIATGVAYPTMQKLWKTNDNDLALITTLLNRFEFWGWVSTIAHLLAFSILVSCLFALQLK